MADRMRRIASFRNAPAAYIAASVLDTEGIPYEIRDEHTAWLVSEALGGVKLFVPAEHAERAIALLAPDEAAAIPDAEE